MCNFSNIFYRSNSSREKGFVCCVRERCVSDILPCVLREELLLLLLLLLLPVCGGRSRELLC